MKLCEMSNWGKDWGNDDDSVDEPFTTRRISGLKNASGDVYVEPKKKNSKPLSRKKQKELNRANLEKYSNRDKKAEFFQLWKQYDDREYSKWNRDLYNTLGMHGHVSNRSPKQKELIDIFQPLLDKLSAYDRAAYVARDDVELDALRANLVGRYETQTEINTMLDAIGVELKPNWF